MNCILQSRYSDVFHLIFWTKIIHTCSCCCCWQHTSKHLGSLTSTKEKQRQVLLTFLTQVIPVKTLTSDARVCTKMRRSRNLVISSMQTETVVCVGGGGKLHPPGNARSLSQHRLYKYQRQYQKSYLLQGCRIGPQTSRKVSAHIKGAL